MFLATNTAVLPSILAEKVADRKQLGAILVLWTVKGFDYWFNFNFVEQFLKNFSETQDEWHLFVVNKG